MTLDALHTSETTATEIVECSGGHYLFTVKKNQKLLRQQLEELYRQADKRKLDKLTTVDKKHGRKEKRTVIRLDLANSGLTFAHALTALKIVRERTARKGKKKGIETSREIVYMIASIPYSDLTCKKAGELARGHWSIENKLHHVKDASMLEDRSRTKNGAARIMSAVRTLVTRLFSQCKKSYTQTARYIAGNVRCAIKVITSNKLNKNDLRFSG